VAVLSETGAHNRPPAPLGLSKGHRTLVVGTSLGYLVSGSVEILSVSVVGVSCSEQGPNSSSGSCWNPLNKSIGPFVLWHRP
jgi:hypothetical protein